MSRNIHGLSLEDELVTILPLYRMYSNTIRKNLTPTVEDLRQAPPGYELTPQTLAALTPAVSPLAEPDDYFGAEATEENLLENAYKLPRLALWNRNLYKDLGVEIVFTELVGKIGKKPVIIDPTLLELKQGDYLYGYVLITNRTQHEIPFDVLAVTLDGVEMIYDELSVTIPSVMERFLLMFDFAALWNDAYLDRLVSDHNNPHHLDHLVDPVDGLFVQLDLRKVLRAGVTYKKFFAFRLPEKCLDSVCRHGLVKHLQLPPTMGVGKYQRMLAFQKKRTATESEPVPTHTPDLAFPDAVISYCILARIIGPLSNYDDIITQRPPGKADQYVIVNEAHTYFRVVPATNPLFELNRDLITKESRFLYLQMLREIKQCIENGRAMPDCGRLTPEPAVRPLLAHTMSHDAGADAAKMQQSYLPLPAREPELDYRVVYPIKKQLVFKSKVTGVVVFSTPRVDYIVPYHSPGTPRKLRILDIPIDLEFTATDDAQPVPDIRKVSAEVISLTVRLKRNAIPVVLVPDMIFDNKGKNTDNFDMLTIKKFQGFAQEIARLMKTKGFTIDNELLMDIKAIANLTTKYDYLRFDTAAVRHDGEVVLSIALVPWKLASRTHHKTFSVAVDMALLPSDTQLVPDFQSCLFARVYYIRLKFRVNGEKLVLRVPLIIQRDFE